MLWFPKSAGGAAAFADLRHRVGTHRCLVNLGAPAGACRQVQATILDVGADGDQIIFPGHVVDIDFHDPEIADGGAEMRTHHG